VSRGTHLWVRFIAAEKDHYPIALMCRTLRVSRSGSYAWQQRGPSARAVADEQLTAQIVVVHQQSRGTYGTPRVQAQLQAMGQAVSRKRVARLMRHAGLIGAQRRRRVRTTVADPTAMPAPNLVQRQFQAQAPNQLWVGDMTFIPTDEGWLYLAVLLDVYSRRVVGWAMAEHLRADLALAALDMALHQRRPRPGQLVHHTDRGCQYTAAVYQARLAAADITVSMSRTGDCFDNALAESFFGSLKRELVDDAHWLTRRAARTAIFDWLEVFYNRQRLHSALGYRSPAVFEATTYPLVA
jgi:transposase InsO family protein